MSVLTELKWDDELELACTVGDFAAAKARVAEGANPQAQHPRSGMTYLHGACCNGHIEIVQWLVKKYRLRPKAKTKFGRTPLEMANKCRNPSVAVWLEQGILKDDCESFDGSMWDVTLGNACWNGDLRTIQARVQAGAIPEAMHPANGLSYLHVACCCGQLPVVQWLVRYPLVLTETYFCSNPLTQPYL